MFDFFRRRTAKEFMDEARERYNIPPVLESQQPKKEESVVCYSVGPTSDNRVNLTVGWSSITMNRKGCQSLIDALSVAMNNLEEETEEDVQEHN